MKEIPLTKGKVALVDDDDFERVNQYKWHAVKKSNGFYAARKECATAANGLRKDKTIYMHRFILGVLDGEFVDHRDHNTLDNRKTNIRVCTKANNQCNQRKRRGNYTSQFKGVRWRDDMGKWNARVHFRGKEYNLGWFVGELEAAFAYDKKARELFGEFANPNFQAFA